MTLALHMEHCVLPVMLKPATQKDQSGQIKAVREPLFGYRGHSSASQVGGDHFSTLLFHKLTPLLKTLSSLGFEDIFLLLCSYFLFLLQTRGWSLKFIP